MLVPGSGDARPTTADEVRLLFTAWNAQGEVSDGSDKRGGPVTFAVTGVIAGWTEALQQMRVGERRRIWVPDHLAYPGRPGPPRPLAMFELELLEIIQTRPALPAPEDLAAPPAAAKKTGSGVAYVILTKGSGGEKPNGWDRVSVHYAAWKSDGSMLERSHKDRPTVFDLSVVTAAWREALLQMSTGDRARVWPPRNLASHGAGTALNDAAVLEFELLSIERRPEPPRAPKQVGQVPANAKRTASGLAYRILRRGTGKVKPTPEDRVEVQYSAWTRDGKLFDSSILKGGTATLPLQRLIPGWAEGLELMVEGDKALFWIPEQLAYKGAEGSPKGMLVYEVELLKIEP